MDMVIFRGIWDILSDGLQKPQILRQVTESPMVGGRGYKNVQIYRCIILNKLAATLDINIEQAGLEGKVDAILDNRTSFVTKADIIHEMRSNYTMATKVLKGLEADGYITTDLEGKAYRVRITKSGILHVRKFNDFYKELYEDQIKDHYLYTGVPSWLRRQKRD